MGRPSFLPFLSASALLHLPVILAYFQQVAIPVSFEARSGISVSLVGADPSAERRGGSAASAHSPDAVAGQTEKAGGAAGVSGVISQRAGFLLLTIQYPELAQMQRMEGVVVVFFHIRPDGSVDGVRIERSSGYRILDESTARSIAGWSFPPGYETEYRLNVRFQMPPD